MRIVTDMTKDEMLKEKNIFYNKVVEEVKSLNVKDLPFYKENNDYKFYPFIFDEINNKNVSTFIEDKIEFVEWFTEMNPYFYRALKEEKTIYIVMYIIESKKDNVNQIIFNYEIDIEIENNYNELFFDNETKSSVYNYLDYQGKMEYYEFKKEN